MVRFRQALTTCVSSLWGLARRHDDTIRQGPAGRSSIDPRGYCCCSAAASPACLDGMNGWNGVARFRWDGMDGGRRSGAAPCARVRRPHTAVATSPYLEWCLRPASAPAPRAGAAVVDRWIDGSMLVLVAAAVMVVMGIEPSVSMKRQGRQPPAAWRLGGGSLCRVCWLGKAGSISNGQDWMEGSVGGLIQRLGHCPGPSPLDRFDLGFGWRRSTRGARASTAKKRSSLFEGTRLHRPLRFGRFKRARDRGGIWLPWPRSIRFMAHYVMAAMCISGQQSVLFEPPFGRLDQDLG